MAWFYNDKLKERCEIIDIKIVNVLPPERYGETAISELKITFRSSMGVGELIMTSRDNYLDKALKAYRAEFYNKKHEQLSLFNARQTKSLVNIS